LLARLKHHLLLHRLQKALFHKTQDLALKNSELEAYAHTIAHSLKTPLAASTRFLEILYKYKSDNLSEEQRHLLQQALTLLTNTGGAIDALLLLSTVASQEVALTPLDMSSVVNKALSQLADLKTNARAEVTLPSVWPRALGYAPWIGEVWVNLISNGFKYSGNPPRLELGGERDGAQVRFWIRDNGEPLSAEACKRIFTPFTRLHQERAAGHGLGLVTVSRIVTKLGGVVSARPLPGRGNEFSFTLPPVL